MVPREDLCPPPGVPRIIRSPSPLCPPSSSSWTLEPEVKAQGWSSDGRGQCRARPRPRTQGTCSQGTKAAVGEGKKGVQMGHGGPLFPGPGHHNLSWQRRTLAQPLPLRPAQLAASMD